MKILLWNEFIDFMQKKRNFLILGSLIIAITLTTLLFLNLNVKKDITITVDKKVLKVESMKSTVKEVLEENDIKLKDDDLIIPRANAKTFNGMKISIKRAAPVVIEVDRKKLITNTSAVKVRELLKQEGIALRSKDKITPSLNSKVTEGMKIKITRVTVKDVAVIERIPFKVIREKVSYLPIGKIKVIRKGSYGVRKIVDKITLEDGKVVKKQRVLTWNKKRAVSTILAVGSLGKFIASRGNTAYYTKRLYMKATSYTANYESTGKSPGDRGFGRTASGRMVERDPDGYSTVAVDPSLIPLGTKLYVEGYGYAIAADTGGAVKGRIIDLYFDPGTSEYQRWYTHHVNVYIVK